MHVLPVGIISYVGKEKGVTVALNPAGELALFVSAEKKPLRWLPIGEVVADPDCLIAQPEKEDY